MPLSRSMIGWPSVRHESIALPMENEDAILSDILGSSFYWIQFLLGMIPEKPIQITNNLKKMGKNESEEKIKGAVL